MKLAIHCKHTLPYCKHSTRAPQSMDREPGSSLTHPQPWTGYRSVTCYSCNRTLDEDEHHAPLLEPMLKAMHVHKFGHALGMRRKADKV